MDVNTENPNKGTAYLFTSNSILFVLLSDKKSSLGVKFGGKTMQNSVKAGVFLLKGGTAPQTKN